MSLLLLPVRNTTPASPANMDPQACPLVTTIKRGDVWLIEQRSRKDDGVRNLGVGSSHENSVSILPVPKSEASRGGMAGTKALTELPTEVTSHPVVTAVGAEALHGPGVLHS